MDSNSHIAKASEKYITPAKRQKQLFGASFSKTLRDSTDQHLELIKQKFFNIETRFQKDSKKYDLAINILNQFQQLPLDQLSQFQNLFEQINAQFSNNSQAEKNQQNVATGPKNQIKDYGIIQESYSKDNQNSQDLISLYDIKFGVNGCIIIKSEIIQNLLSIQTKFMDTVKECKDLISKTQIQYNNGQQNGKSLPETAKELIKHKNDIQQSYEKLIEKYDHKIEQLNKGIIKRDQILDTYNRTLKHELVISASSHKIVQNLQDKINDESLNYSPFESSPESETTNQKKNEESKSYQIKQGIIKYQHIDQLQNSTQQIQSSKQIQNNDNSQDDTHLNISQKISQYEKFRDSILEEIKNKEQKYGILKKKIDNLEEYEYQLSFPQVENNIEKECQKTETNINVGILNDKFNHQKEILENLLNELELLIEKKQNSLQEFNELQISINKTLQDKAQVEADLEKVLKQLRQEEQIYQDLQTILINLKMKFNPIEASVSKQQAQNSLLSQINDLQKQQKELTNAINDIYIAYMEYKTNDTYTNNQQINIIDVERQKYQIVKYFEQLSNANNTFIFSNTKETQQNHKIELFDTNSKFSCSQALGEFREENFTFSQIQSTFKQRIKQMKSYFKYKYNKLKNIHKKYINKILNVLNVKLQLPTQISIQKQLNYRTLLKEISKLVFQQTSDQEKITKQKHQLIQINTNFQSLKQFIKEQQSAILSFKQCFDTNQFATKEQLLTINQIKSNIKIETNLQVIQQKNTDQQLCIKAQNIKSQINLVQNDIEQCKQLLTNNNQFLVDAQFINSQLQYKFLILEVQNHSNQPNSSNATRFIQQFINLSNRLKDFLTNIQLDEQINPAKTIQVFNYLANFFTEMSQNVIQLKESKLISHYILQILTIINKKQVNQYDKLKLIKENILSFKKKCTEYKQSQISLENVLLNQLKQQIQMKTNKYITNYQTLQNSKHQQMQQFIINLNQSFNCLYSQFQQIESQFQIVKEQSNTYNKQQEFSTQNSQQLQQVAQKFWNCTQSNIAQLRLELDQIKNIKKDYFLSQEKQQEILKNFSMTLSNLNNKHNNEIEAINDQYQTNIKVIHNNIHQQQRQIKQLHLTYKNTIQSEITKNHSEYKEYIQYCSQQLQQLFIKCQDKDICIVNLKQQMDQINNRIAENSDNQLHIYNMVYKTLKFFIAREQNYYIKAIKPTIALFKLNTQSLTLSKEYENLLKSQDNQIKQFKLLLESKDQQNMQKQMQQMLDIQKSIYDVFDKFGKIYFEDYHLVLASLKEKNNHN